MGFKFEILHQTEDFVAINKPAGFHVHQPEDARQRVPMEIVVLQQLRNQLGRHVHPVHRLDVSTSGVMILALNKETASCMGRLFSNNEVEKTYYAIVRGHPPDAGDINEPLKSDSSGLMLEASTRAWTLGRVEFPIAVGKRHPVARYALVKAQPLTGRFHQIRRHLARMSHPVIGDASHGDSHHNRFFREHFGLHGLLLTARQLTISDPRTHEPLTIQAPWSEKWENVFAKLGFTPPTEVHHD